MTLKTLLFYGPSFWFKTFKKVLPEAVDLDEEKICHAVIVVFYHVEAEDVSRPNRVLAKLIKNIEWLSGKHNSKIVVPHSFNHLSASKAPSDFARAFVQEAAQRLQQPNYEVTVTLFGYLNEWRLHVAGESLAKVFKEL